MESHLPGNVSGAAIAPGPEAMYPAGGNRRRSLKVGLAAHAIHPLARWRCLKAQMSRCAVVTFAGRRLRACEVIASQEIRRRPR